MYIYKASACSLGVNTPASITTTKTVSTHQIIHRTGRFDEPGDGRTSGYICA
jgi:hypothetical protein